MEMSFTHLSPYEFEELCYDLLQALGAEKLNWRKGSPRPSSPSDQGRDIECVFRCRTVAGDTFDERRFVECKHHNSAVPPRELAEHSPGLLPSDRMYFNSWYQVFFPTP